MDEELVKYMAELLKSGASMLNYTCPACNTPLFKLKSGEVICPKCRRRVYIVKDEREESVIRSKLYLESLEETVLEKLSEVEIALKQCEDLDSLSKASEALIRLLEVLERLRRIGGRGSPEWI